MSEHQPAFPVCNREGTAPLLAQSMIRVTFRSPHTVMAVASDVSHQLRFAGGALHRDDEERCFARYELGGWSIGHVSFEEVSVDRPVFVHFEQSVGRCSALLGPLQEVRLSGGLLYADGRPLGQFDARRALWRYDGAEETEAWERLVISDGTPYSQARSGATAVNP